VKAGHPQSDKKMRIDHDEIIDLDIVESDIRKGEIDYEVKYYDHDTKTLNISKEHKLYLNTQTIDDVIDALKDVDVISGFVDGFSQKEISLVGLQNFINICFRADYVQSTSEYQEFYNKKVLSDF
jgi:hypothetical protein